MSLISPLRHTVGAETSLHPLFNKDEELLTLNVSCRRARFVLSYSDRAMQCLEHKSMGS